MSTFDSSSGSGWYKNEKAFSAWSTGNTTTYYTKGYFIWKNGEANIYGWPGGYDWIPSNWSVVSEDVSHGTYEKLYQEPPTCSFAVKNACFGQIICNKNAYNQTKILLWIEMIMGMKKSGNYAPFIIRCGLFLVVAVVQMLIFWGSDFNLYGGLYRFSAKMYIVIVFLACFSLIQIYKAKRYTYIFVLIECAGTLFSLLSYRRFMGNFAGNDVKDLHILIVVPYIISVLFSIFSSFIYRKNKIFFSNAMCFFAKRGNPIFYKMISIILFIGSIIFGFLGANFVVLGQYLLMSWAFLTSIILYILFNKWNHI